VPSPQHPLSASLLPRPCGHLCAGRFALPRRCVRAVMFLSQVPKRRPVPVAACSGARDIGITPALSHASSSRHPCTLGRRLTHHVVPAPSSCLVDCSLSTTVSVAGENRTVVASRSEARHKMLNPRTFGGGCTRYCTGGYCTRYHMHIYKV